MKSLSLSFASLLFLAVTILFSACDSQETVSTEYRIFVGTSTGDASVGIYSFRFDTQTGALVEEGHTPQVFNPSYITISPDGEYLYSVNEGGRENSAVSAFRIDRATGALERLNQQPSYGPAPCYVSTDRTGRWVFSAHYTGGSVALFPVEADGRLGEAADTVQHTGSGPNTSRQERAHAHFIRPDPQDRFVYAVDLGIDRIRIYELDRDNGELLPKGEAAVAPGAGPRHLTFHPNGRYAYVINELNGTVTAFHYNADDGSLTEFQTESTLPAGYTGDNGSADIHVHPSGNFLYASNRGETSSIAIFTIDESTGRLTLAGHQVDLINWPRNFAIDPTGNFLLAANQRGNDIVVFRIDEQTGQLTPTGHSVAVPGPTCIQFHTVAG